MKKKSSSFNLKKTVGRLGWVMSKLYRGSQSKMAADLGVSQPTLSNVLAGRQLPGRKLLMAVAAHPLVNERWMLFGEGAPLSESLPAAPTAELMLPTASQLLPGPLEANRHLLTDSYVPVLPCDFAPSRYWLQVTIDQADQGLLAGTSLLMETDASLFDKQDLVRGKWCAVVAPPNSEPRLRHIANHTRQQGYTLTPTSSWWKTALAAPVVSHSMEFILPEFDSFLKRLIRHVEARAGHPYQSGGEWVGDMPEETARSGEVVARPGDQLVPHPGMKQTPADVPAETKDLTETVPPQAIVGVAVLMQRRWPLK